MSTTEPLSVLSTAPVTLEYRGGDPGEVVLIYNPGIANSNRVWVRTNGDPAVAGINGEIVVGPGQYSPPLLLLPGQNASGVRVLAETGTTVVTVLRTPFRGRTERFIATLAIFGGLLGNLWRQISATAVELIPGLTEARADTVDAKTAANGLSLGSAGTVAGGGVRVGSVALAALTARVGVGTTFRSYAATNEGAFVSGTLRHFVQAGSISHENDTPFIYNFGNTADPRHTLNSTDRVRHTAVAGGLIASQVLDSAEWVIANGVTLNVGDLCQFTSGNTTVTTATAASMKGVGIVIVGGTGNPGGTVFARIREVGVLGQTITADTNGVVLGQYGYPGGTTPATRIESKTTADGSFCAILTTAANGALTDVRLAGRS